MSILLTALGVAAKAQAEVILIMSAGIAASAYGLLGPANISNAAKLYLVVLQPCLMFSLTRSFSLERLASFWPVLVISLVHIALGAVLGWLVSRALRLPSPRRELLLLTTAFGNCGALPFVLVLPIVRAWPVTRDDPTAHETGLAVIGLYVLVWFVVFFSAGTAYCKRIRSAPTQRAAPTTVTTETATSDAECPGDIAVTVASSPTNSSRVLASVRSSTVYQRLTRIPPAVYQILLSFLMGCITPLREALGERGWLGWLGSGWHSLGSCGIVLSTIVLGAGLWNGFQAERRAKKKERSTGGGSAAEEEVDHRVDGPHKPPAGGAGTFVAAACILRLVLLPAMCLPMHLALTAWKVLPNEPTLLMILTISAGCPSSQTLVMVLNASGDTATAEEVSKVYVPMYALSVFSVATLIFVCCLVVGQPPPV